MDADMEVDVEADVEADEGRWQPRSWCVQGTDPFTSVPIPSLSPHLPNLLPLLNFFAPRPPWKRLPQ